MKRKFSLFINIATLVLCVCAIAFGVYSAKTASLTISGSVGFKAHNCKVKVDSSLSGFSATKDGEPVTTARTSSVIVDGGVNNGTAELDLGTMYFTDLTASGNINNITLSLTFTNQSDFKVDIVITAKDLSSSNITVALDKTSLTLAEQTATEGKTDTVKITLSTTSTGITDTKFEILSVSMEKKTAAQATGLTVQSGAIYGLTGDRTYVTMGKYESQTENIKWYIFAQGDGINMTAVNGKVDNNGTLPSGTYWFISEYVLGKSAFGSNNTYEGSTIQKYLTEGSFIATYGIDSSNPVYSKITGRTINDVADPSNNVGAVTTSTPQTFWLLSYSEVNLLSNKVANDISSSTASVWWLRSPRSNTGGMVAFNVLNDGSVYNDPVNCSYRVRAAFQITI